MWHRVDRDSAVHISGRRIDCRRYLGNTIQLVETFAECRPPLVRRNARPPIGRSFAKDSLCAADAYGELHVHLKRATQSPGHLSAHRAG